jgi:hypothetical protein
MYLFFLFLKDIAPERYKALEMQYENKLDEFEAGSSEKKQIERWLL